MRENIIYYNKIIDNESNKLIEINHKFESAIRNNEFAKHLRKIFNKKLKIPKEKLYDDDGGKYSNPYLLTCNNFKSL